MQGMQAVMEIDGGKPHAQFALFPQGPPGSVSEQGESHDRVAAVPELEDRIRVGFLEVDSVATDGKAKVEDVLGHLCARPREKERETAHIEKHGGAKTWRSSKAPGRPSATTGPSRCLVHCYGCSPRSVAAPLFPVGASEGTKNHKVATAPAMTIFAAFRNFIEMLPNR